MLGALTLTLGLLPAAAEAAQLEAAETPDVLFIIVDDLNDWVGPLGHPETRTPNMDRLAERGMVFTNAHTPAPLCNPSRTALLTGLRPSSSGIYDNGWDWRTLDVFEGLPTLPRYFRDSGYRTVGGGKIFHAHTYNAQGFFGLNDLTAWTGFYPAARRQLPDEVTPPDAPVNGTGVTWDWGVVEVDDDAMADGRVVSYIEQEIASQSRGPRFIAAGIYRPHLPWYVPEEYFDMYPLEEVQLPPIMAGDLDDVPLIAHPAFMNSDLTHTAVLEDGQWPDAVQAYLASISFADAMVGRLIDALERSGGLDDTIIVMMSDHGFHLGEKERWRKNTLWERSTHVPLIVVAPGVTTPGSRSGAPVSLMDVYPTLTELAGLATPEHVEGTSLVPLLEDPDAEWNHAAVTTQGFGNHSIRDGRYRYTRHTDGTEEVYDLWADPNEWHNRAEDPAFAEVKSALAAFLPETNVGNPAFTR